MPGQQGLLTSEQPAVQGVCLQMWEGGKEGERRQRENKYDQRMSYAWETMSVQSAYTSKEKNINIP